MTTEIADKLFDAIQARDMATVRSVFTDDVVLWHNFDLAERNLDQIVANLTMMLSVVKDVRYVDRDFIAIPGGIVGQYVHRGMAITGKPVALHVMLRFYLAGGLIKRIEEYVDSGECAVIHEAAKAA
jgi:ketosteroid isomerase-like protein